MRDDANSPWTEATDARWRSIAAHAFEDAAAPLDFCHRIAREQGWSLSEARAAIEEYRRYCFLITVMAGEVVPSVAYAETLAEYGRWFGTPDERWWPGTQDRFRAPERFRRVDRERAWIIPKPVWSRA